MSEDIADYDCDSDAESCSMSRPSSCASSQDDLDMLVDSSFQVITSKEVVERMNIEIRKASETMNIPPTAARIILDRYNWQTSRAIEKFFEGDRETFFRDAGIFDPSNSNNNCCDIVAECGICFDTDEVTGLQCGHKFCRSCWDGYLTTKINDFGEQTIPCAQTNCNIMVEDAIIKKLVSNPNILLKYNRLICNKFVKWRKDLHWCKTPGCDYVIDTFDKYVTCKCGCEFCCCCYEHVHAPIACRLLEKWKSDDSATHSYLAVNTKPCPKCIADIEKNGGCPHMTCSNCKHEFCWKCLKDWKKHDTAYNCAEKLEDNETKKHRSVVERLRYCWDRYAYNKQAIKDEAERFDITWEEYEHRFELRNAIEKITKCRRFLMYSYAFVFYLKEDNGVYLFENTLDYIESKADMASVAMENYIRLKEENELFAIKEKDIRFSILDGAYNCDQQRQRWLDDVEIGHDEGRWDYRDDYELLVD